MTVGTLLVGNYVGALHTGLIVFCMPVRIWKLFLRLFDWGGRIQFLWSIAGGIVSGLIAAMVKAPPYIIVLSVFSGLLLTMGLMNIGIGIWQKISERVIRSKAARDLLLEAVKDPQGSIMRASVMASEQVQINTNGRDFVEIGNPRSEVQWPAALNQLRQLGLVKDREEIGGAISPTSPVGIELFYVTDAGFQAADALGSWKAVKKWFGLRKS